MEKVSISKTVQEQIDWLSGLIMPNGELVMHNKPSNNVYRIIPYFSNIAAVALLEDPQKFSLVKKYILWYLSNLNYPDKYGVTGTIYDYHLRTNGELISTKDYDSYDSYPATILTLCRKYFEGSGDQRFFDLNKKHIDTVTTSMLSSMDKDYLTWAKPNYRVKYLMDNCEVHQGLLDAAFIYSAIYQDNDYSNKLKDLADKNLKAIESKLYNSKGYYYYVIDEADKGSEPDYSKWYPDATSQLFPILFGILKPGSELAKSIYNKFNSHFPNWQEGKEKNDFPDAYVAYIAYLMKDFEKAKSFCQYCDKTYIAKGNVWPWYSVESSYFIRTMIGIENAH